MIVKEGYLRTQRLKKLNELYNFILKFKIPYASLMVIEHLIAQILVIFNATYIDILKIVFLKLFYDSQICAA